MTIGKVKEKLSKKINLKVQYMVLIYGGKQLNDDSKDLKYLHIHKEATLHLVNSLTGGERRS
jgi:hypothetical protein